MKEISLYIHIPFCIKKCNYCSFYSIRGWSSIFRYYIKTLIKEILLKKELLKDRKIKTIYFGGGTPSILNPSLLEEIITALDKIAEFRKDIEITVEVNPETIEAEKFKKIKSIGINRISLGAQSFNDKTLKFLRRIHDSEKIKESFNILREIGFDNINVDFIMGTPTENSVDFLKTLEEVVRLNPEHISVYSLEYHNGTPLYLDLLDGKVTPISKGIEKELYKTTSSYLTGNSYIHYEISNYSKPGRESKHNLNYWLGGEYFGFGASSVSYLDNQWIENEVIHNYFKRVKDNEVPTKRVIILSREKMERMLFILNLRLIEGIPITKIKLSLISSELIQKLRILEERNLLKREKGKIKLTEEGVLVSNEVFSYLI